MKSKEEKKGKKKKRIKKVESKQSQSNWIGLSPNPIRLKLESLIGGTNFLEGAGVLIKPRVDHRWRANIWAPSGEEG